MDQRDRAIEVCGELRHVKTCVDELREMGDGSDRNNIVADSVIQICNRADAFVGKLSDDALRLLDAVSQLEGVEMEYGVSKRLAEAADELRATLGNSRLIKS